MNGYKNDLPEVERLGRMRITGNIIPAAWYKNIKFENGKPDLNAIIILADIVYWYKPFEVRDEATGRCIESRKKFKEDKLQRSYSSFADLFGLSKDQVKMALDRLCEIKVIDCEFRTVHYNGSVANNVLFIGLNPEELAKITYSAPLSESVRGGSSNLLGEALLIDSETNTEITTETTTEVKKDYSSFSQNSEPKKPTSADVYKERIRNAMATGIEDHKKKTQNGEAYVANFPADVQDVIGRICKLWMITPPQKSSSSFGFWIKAARELRTTCGEYGLDIIDEVFDNIPREMVAGPASLINMARARVAEHNRTVAPIDPGADDLSYHWDSSLTVEENERLMNEKRQKVAQEGG